MAIEIWQTTNQEPWVSALVDGVIAFKTRTSKPCVPVGAPVLLHASTKVWPAWREFRNPIMRRYAEAMTPSTRGRVLGVGIVSRICLASEYSKKARRPWDMFWGNCCATWAWACDPIIKLDTPVKICGFQAPFARQSPKRLKLYCHTIHRCGNG